MRSWKSVGVVVSRHASVQATALVAPLDHMTPLAALVGLESMRSAQTFASPSLAWSFAPCTNLDGPDEVSHPPQLQLLIHIQKNSMFTLIVSNES